jgi:hypothetical protein
MQSKFSDDPLVREGPLLIAKREREWRERREQQKRAKGATGSTLLPYSYSSVYGVHSADAFGASDLESLLPADVLYLVAGKVVDDALATADRRVARQSIANLACINRQFRQMTSIVFSERVESAQRFVSTFVDTGSIDTGSCARIDEFLDQGRSMQKLPFLSVCLFGCSLPTLMKSPSTIPGFFKECSKSKLSVEICTARAAVGHDRRPLSPCLCDETRSNSVCEPQTQRKPRGVRRPPPTKVFKLLQVAALAR